MVIDKPNQKILDITNFHGSKNMVLENYINYLKNLNSQTTLDFLGHKLLSSYINKLLDYKKTSNTTTTEFQEFIEYVNEEYQYLKNKFPYIHIDFQGRIKSLISADNKIKKDLKNSILNGENIEDSNIKDIIAYRYILSIPKNIAQTEEQEIDLCYKFFEEQIKFNLNNRHKPIIVKHLDSSSSTDLLSRASKNNIYIPKKEYCSQFSKYVKDYIKHPKDSLYQALHVRYSIKSLPFECQIKTKRMHEYAEFGGARHSNYKPRNNFNINKVPQELGFVKTPNGNKIDFLSIDESIKLYYGYNFKDIYGISFEEFNSNYTQKQQSIILRKACKINEDGSICLKYSKDSILNNKKYLVR